jgi:magnesium chelatase family protein
MVQRYQKRISGPLMDRIDIHLDVQRVPYHKLEAAGTGEPSTAIRARVAAARQIQGERFAPLNRPHVLVNGDIGSPLGAAEVQRFCELDETGKNLMRAAVQQMNLSARAYHRVLKLARTIADLAGEGRILPTHLAEALQYRPREIG